MMFEIKGKFNIAACYAKVIEDEAINQIRRMCDYPLTERCKVAIMPDVHAGKGCTVGTTMTIIDKACPNIVGVDIGCGMYTVRLKNKKLDYQSIDEACHYIPSGMRVWDGKIEDFNLTELRCYDRLRAVERLECSLGTLGSGNHFIEIDQSADGTYYLIVHSGSRNLGKQVAEIYQEYAIDLHSGREEYINRRKELIAEYQKAGKSSDIFLGLQILKEEFEQLSPHVPHDLCWLSGEKLDDYLHDVEICQRFAKRNREKMAEIILERTSLKAVDGFHTIHNYIDVNEMILRKGAISAHKDEMVLIPINMRDGSVIAIGKGNSDWNYSAPHGVGRLMSRSQARKAIDIADYRETMKGIYTSSVNTNTIDESPMAYKSLDDIIDVIQDTVDIIEVMKPVYNFKASEEQVKWK